MDKQWIERYINIIIIIIIIDTEKSLSLCVGLAFVDREKSVSLCVGLCNGGMIYEEKKMLLGIVVKNEEC